ncbi:MAG: hypothetical protein ACK5Z5_08670 [Neisseriaceae bacterium]
MLALDHGILPEKLLEQTDSRCTDEYTLKNLRKLFDNNRNVKHCEDNTQLTVIIREYGSVMADIGGHFVMIDEINMFGNLFVREPFLGIYCKVKSAFAERILSFWYIEDKVKPHDLPVLG